MDAARLSGTHNPEREGPGALVDLVRAERPLVPTLRVLHRPSTRRRLGVPVHDLHRHVALAREDEQPGAVREVERPVGAGLLERGEAPGADERVLPVIRPGRRAWEEGERQQHGAV